MIHIQRLFLFFLCLTPIISEAQLPKTQIYLFDIKPLTDDYFEFTRPKYLTSFNSNGYNNQPHFINERALYFTMQTPSGDQTDIYGLNLYKKNKYQVTDTPDGEYSPTVMPGGKDFSCIREEYDGKKTQRLWKFPIDRSGKGSRIFEDVTGVGYHHWIGRTKVLMFIVGTPHKLIIGETDTQKTREVATNIGRCMQTLPNGNVAFIEKVSDKTWYLKELDINTYKINIMIEVPDGSEDFVITSDGTVMLGKGSKLYKYNQAYDKKWVEIGDFSHYGINNITRLAHNGNRKIAIVNKEE